MQIAHWIRALVAVLGFAAVLPVSCSEHFNNTLFDRSKRSIHKHHHDSWYDHDVPLRLPGKFLNHRDNQMLLREESSSGNNGSECCPSVLEMIEPQGGKNRQDQFVELYRDGDYTQRFYERSCHKDILGKPCRFMDKKLHEHSKCIQKYSYTYALVRDLGRHHMQRPKNFPSLAAPGGATWTLDYIRIRSGCACVVTPNKKKRDRLKHRKTRVKDDTS
ncbi:uncharacterized protein LOC103315170 [Tribolium castaneum]|uniref:Spaetzle domain-containing protein n=1 Tax=Tribolium castaneum TaxID=7070 RepID=D6W8M6_TRICA|nr:PREDICTED: uncharacterized protein LOC103315170 [Tribolium castaneum]XP_015840781.1 PREDICTED: uncharacterized protein LOC103315170 [Tribolium castaneum]EEZ98286.1 hypothetical protein TcasGA2_TC000734 [Tribolium castaneum]|eukprot:XP_008201373.1 PREDICTED: uncharacterized protein LOC103315170 [Tribolium castaneum]